MITIGDARKALRLLENEVLESISRFEMTTDCTVSDVELHHEVTFTGELDIVGVVITVEL